MSLVPVIMMLSPVLSYQEHAGAVIEQETSQLQVEVGVEGISHLVWHGYEIADEGMLVQGRADVEWTLNNENKGAPLRSISLFASTRQVHQASSPDRTEDPEWYLSSQWIGGVRLNVEDTLEVSIGGEFRHSPAEVYEDTDEYFVRLSNARSVVDDIGGVYAEVRLIENDRYTSESVAWILGAEINWYEDQFSRQRFFVEMGLGSDRLYMDDQGNNTTFGRVTIGAESEFDLAGMWTGKASRSVFLRLGLYGDWLNDEVVGLVDNDSHNDFRIRGMVGLGMRF